MGNLQAAVSWSYLECVHGALYLVALVIAISMMRKQFLKGFLVLAVTQIMMIQTTIFHLTPKIEAYTQRAAIDFYNGLAGKDVYIHPVGFKSYAHLFYGRKQPAADKLYYLTDKKEESGKVLPPQADQEWLLDGAVDRPVYFVCKVQDAEKWRHDNRVTEVSASNGFVFFKRKG